MAIDRYLGKGWEFVDSRLELLRSDDGARRREI
jgi:hypothetical protein